MKSKVLLFSAALFGLCAGELRAEDWPLGFPTAPPPSANAVPIETIRKYALSQAKELWGEVTPGTELPCRDSNGDTLAYMLVFRRGAAPFGKYSEITDRIKTGRKLRVEGEQEMRKMVPPKLAPLALDAGLATAAQSPQAPQSMQQPSPELLKAQEKFQTGKKMMWGIDEYGTLVFSARNDRFPVPERIHGLPVFFTKLDLLRDKVREAIGGSPKLTGMYYLMPGEEWFEFTSGNRKALIDPHSMKISTLEKAIKPRMKKAPVPGAPLSPLQQQVQEEWKKLENAQ